MNLLALKTETLNHGFDPIQYGSRIVQYINDALLLISSQVDYYEEEAVQVLTTVAGTDTYAWSSNLAAIRSVFDTARAVELQYVGLREFDRSNSTTQGPPTYYAISGQNVRLYPIPDGVYTIDVRYWAQPTTLKDDGDVPALPVQWHPLLWVYATWQCYEADDDSQMGQYWEGRWNRMFSSFKADVKFPTSDGPVQAKGMWEQGGSLSGGSAWTYYG